MRDLPILLRFKKFSTDDIEAPDHPLSSPKKKYIAPPESNRRVLEIDYRTTKHSAICSFFVFMSLLIVVGAILFVLFFFVESSVITKPDQGQIDNPLVKGPVIFEGEVVIINREYNAALANRDSKMYTDLEKEFTEAVNTVALEDKELSLSYAGVRVTSFNSGSVVVTFEMQFCDLGISLTESNMQIKQAMTLLNSDSQIHLELDDTRTIINNGKNDLTTQPFPCPTTVALTGTTTIEAPPRSDSLFMSLSPTVTSVSSTTSSIIDYINTQSTSPTMHLQTIDATSTVVAKAFSPIPGSYSTFQASTTELIRTVISPSVSTSYSTSSPLVSSGYSSISPSLSAGHTTINRLMSTGYNNISPSVSTGHTTMSLLVSTGYSTRSPSLSAGYTPINTLVSTGYNAISPSVSTGYTTISSSMSTGYANISSSVPTGHVTSLSTDLTSINPSFSLVHTTISPSMSTDYIVVSPAVSTGYTTSSPSLTTGHASLSSSVSTGFTGVSPSMSTGVRSSTESSPVMTTISTASIDERNATTLSFTPTMTIVNTTSQATTVPSLLDSSTMIKPTPSIDVIIKPTSTMSFNVSATFSSSHMPYFTHASSTDAFTSQGVTTQTPVITMNSAIQQTNPLQTSDLYRSQSAVYSYNTQMTQSLDSKLYPSKSAVTSSSYILSTKMVSSGKVNAPSYSIVSSSEPFSKLIQTTSPHVSDFSTRSTQLFPTPTLSMPFSIMDTVFVASTSSLNVMGTPTMTTGTVPVSNDLVSSKSIVFSSLSQEPVYYSSTQSALRQSLHTSQYSSSMSLNMTENIMQSYTIPMEVRSTLSISPSSMPTLPTAASGMMTSSLKPNSEKMFLSSSLPAISPKSNIMDSSIMLTASPSSIIRPTSSQTQLEMSTASVTTEPTTSIQPEICRQQIQVIDVGEIVTVQTPNYPHNYSNDVSCRWLYFSIISGTNVVITFTTFDLGDDVLEVIDDDTIIASLAGSDLPMNITAKSGTMELIFRSNDILPSKGFEAKVTVIYESTPPVTATTLAPPATTNKQTNTTSPVLEVPTPSEQPITQVLNTTTVDTSKLLTTEVSFPECKFFKLLNIGQIETIQHLNYSGNNVTGGNCTWVFITMENGTYFVVRFLDFNIGSATLIFTDEYNRVFQSFSGSDNLKDIVHIGKLVTISLININEQTVGFQAKITVTMNPPSDDVAEEPVTDKMSESTSAATQPVTITTALLATSLLKNTSTAAIETPEGNTTEVPTSVSTNTTSETMTTLTNSEACVDVKLLNIGQVETFQSRNYPEPYPSNTRCSWLFITLSEGAAYFVVTFLTFDIGTGIMIFTDANQNTIESFTGANVPSRIVYSGRLLTIYLMSDTESYPGFSAEVTVVDTKPEVETAIGVTQATTTHSGLTTATENQVPSTEIETNVCAMQILPVSIETFRQISTPLYPSWYPAGSDCVWIIFSLTQSTVLSMSFLEFNLGSDVLNVYYSVSDDDLLTSLTGSGLPAEVRTSRSYLRLSMQSNSSNPGFFANILGLPGTPVTDTEQTTATSKTPFILTTTSPILTPPPSACIDGKIALNETSVEQINVAGPYSMGLECTWVINSTIPNARIQLQLRTFYISDDILELYTLQGDIETSPVEFGQAFQPPDLFEAQANHDVVIKFRSNGNRNESYGFSIFLSLLSPAVIPTCETVQKAINPGELDIIDSPGYPFPYPQNLSCTWVYYSTLGHSPLLQILTFDIGEDKLVLNFGSNINSISLTGIDAPSIVVSPTSYIILTFESSYSNPGFRIQVTAVERPISAGFPGTSLPLGLDDAQEDTTELPAQPTGCRPEYILIYADSTPRPIYSPGYPGKYPSNSKCRWELTIIEQANSGLQIRAQFVTFQLGDDVIEVTYGAKRPKRLSGSTLPQSIVSRNSYMKILFSSDGYNNFSGFKIIISVISMPS